MKVHLNQIPLEGLHIEGEEDSQFLEVDHAVFKRLGPVYYSLDVGLSGTGLFATGTIAVDLELECVKGLEKFVYRLNLDGFALQTEIEGREMVDLTPYVREDILLNLPPYPHCDWNGEHNCVGVQNLTSREINGEAPVQAQKVWEELEKLKIK